MCVFTLPRYNIFAAANYATTTKARVTVLFAKGETLLPRKQEEEKYTRSGNPGHQPR